MTCDLLPLLFVVVVVVVLSMRGAGMSECLAVVYMGRGSIRPHPLIIERGGGSDPGS